MIPRLVVLLLAAAVVAAHFGFPHRVRPVAGPDPLTLLLLVVFAVGLVVRYERAHRDPHREMQRRRARLSQRRWADDVQVPDRRRRRDPDPALPFNDPKGES
jgi:hypothetical protein